MVPKQDMAKKLLMEADLTDLRYLYRYGEYISDSELKTAAFLNSLPEETIATMADTFTEGYRIGFITTNKDISKKRACAFITTSALNGWCGELFPILRKSDSTPLFTEDVTRAPHPTDSIATTTRMTICCSLTDSI